MVGDIVIIEPIHRLKAKIILPRIIRDYKSKMVVCIGGFAGTGKTEISVLVQRGLWYEHRLRSKIIHIDDYYWSDFHDRNETRKITGIVGKDEISWEKINEVIENFRSGNEILHTQRIHAFIDNIEHVQTPGDSVDILIVDGLYANYIEDKDFGVHLDGDVEQTYDFRKKRSKENPDSDFRKYVLLREAKDVAQSKQYVDLTIPFEIVD